MVEKIHSFLPVCRNTLSPSTNQQKKAKKELGEKPDFFTIY